MSFKIGPKMHFEEFNFIESGEGLPSISSADSFSDENEVDFGFTESSATQPAAPHEVPTAKEREHMITMRYLQVQSHFQYIVDANDYVHCLVEKRKTDLRNGIKYPFPEDEVIEKLRLEHGIK